MNKIKENLSLIIVSIATIIYLLFVYKLTNLDAFSNLKPNEVGDYLAGVFAPLAFLWLVFGYYQQGRELKLNTKALELQARELQISNESLKQQVKEMEKSVEAQKNMFQLAERQYEETILEKKESNQPKIKFLAEVFKYQSLVGLSPDHLHQFKATISVKNKPVRNLVIESNYWCLTTGGKSYDNSRELIIKSLDLVSSATLFFYVRTNTLLLDNNTITLTFYDDSNRHYYLKFKINFNTDGFVMFEDL